jgi:hypothetical protein
MRDQKKWTIAISRFNGYCEDIPSWPKAEEVEDYHGYIKALEEASGEDLSHFKIPPEKIKPKIISARRRGYGGSPGHTQYSDVGYCDSDFFEAQIRGLRLYLAELQRKPQLANKYEALSDEALQDLMITRNPNPGEMIEHLLRQDRSREPSHSTTTNYNYNLHHSSMIADSPGANITTNVGVDREELRNFITGLKELLMTVPVAPEAKEQINIDIGTIEIQIGSSKPNVSIIRESLKSLKVIAENAAGSLLAAGLTPAVMHLLSKLP